MYSIFITMKKFLPLLLLFPIFCFSQSMPYTNLALEGGGVHGIAYAGAFKALEEKGIIKNIEKIAGTSAGAIAGLAACLNYTAAEMDSVLMSLKFEKLNDGKGGLFGKYKRVKNKFGIYKGDKFEKWLRAIIENKTGKPDLTFKQLHELHITNPAFKDLYCTGTNVSKQRLEIFSYENTPNFSLATAVRISASIPFYFEPIALDDNLKPIKKGDTTSFINYYVDGGAFCNFPISMFDTCIGKGNPLQCNTLKFNTATLGLKLERPAQIDSFQNNSTSIPYYKPKNIREYVMAFTNLTMENLARRYAGLENEQGRTVYISFGKTNSFIKKMSEAEKRFLFANGEKAVIQFFENKDKLSVKQ
jgi:NTE family protein